MNPNTAELLLTGAQQASPFVGFIFWTYTAASVLCLALLGRIGFDLLQKSRPCAPGVDRLVVALILVGLGFAVVPVFGLAPSLGGAIAAVAVDLLLWTISGGDFMLVRRPGRLRSVSPKRSRYPSRIVLHFNSRDR